MHHAIGCLEERGRHELHTLLATLLIASLVLLVTLAPATTPVYAKTTKEDHIQAQGSLFGEIVENRLTEDCPSICW
jgi:hypothetical protein